MKRGMVLLLHPNQMFDMYRQIWRHSHASVARISFFTQDKINVLSLTGFKSRDYLITDDYVRMISHYDHLEIKFVDQDGVTPRASKVLTKSEFERRMVVGLSDKFQDIVLVNIDFEVFRSIPNLELREDDQPEIGAPVAAIGYKLNQSNMSIKQGMISSYYMAGGIKYLQLDMTIKQGNAGSPVVSADTGHLIGIIGHRLSEVSQSYKKLKDILNSNIQLLKRYQGRYNLQDIDPVQVLIANQNQVKYIAKEIYRVTTMGVGYALPSRHILGFLKENVIEEKSRTHASKDILAGF